MATVSILFGPFELFEGIGALLAPMETMHEVLSGASEPGRSVTPQALPLIRSSGGALIAIALGDADG